MPTRYALTLTALVEPPLADAYDVGRRVAEQHLNGTPIMASSAAADTLGQAPAADRDPRRATWTVLGMAAESDDVADWLATLNREIGSAARSSGATLFEVIELTAVSVDELARQARENRPHLVGVKEFCKMLGREGGGGLSRSRFHELAATDPRFPRPVRPGAWTEAQATAYAALDRPGRGRPAKDRAIVEA